MNLAIFIRSKLRVDDYHPFNEGPQAIVGSHTILIPAGVEQTAEGQQAANRFVFASNARPQWVDLFEIVEIGRDAAWRPTSENEGLDWFDGEQPMSRDFAEGRRQDHPSLSASSISCLFLPLSVQKISVATQMTWSHLLTTDTRRVR